MKTLAERFEEKVDRVNGTAPAHRPELGPCHLWKGATIRHGRGTFYVNGRNEVAPRVAFFLKHGRWPEPNALHHCDNPACVRDDHLWEGTNKDNSADMVAKGRSTAGDKNPSRLYPERRARGDRNGSRTQPDSLARGDRHGSHTHPESRTCGERNGQAKLSAANVDEIRAARAAGVKQRDLAHRFGVGEPCISMIVNGRSWAERETP